jgi:GntR family transcriptional repressor for pyruvate dehydrogenase complex
MRQETHARRIYFAHMRRVPPPVPVNLSDRVVEYLIDYTRRHRLACGAEIPSEGQVSEDLHVSRSVVREAYRALKAAGVLDIGNGRSPRVGRLSNRGFAQFLLHALHTEQATPAHVLDLRFSIEVRAAELAALQRTEDDVIGLKREAGIMRNSLAQRQRFTNADIRFHQILGRATGNPLFELLSSALFESLGQTIRAGFDSRSSKTERRRVAQLHFGIADAIGTRNPVQARRLITLHFDEARTFMLRYAALAHVAHAAPNAGRLPGSHGPRRTPPGPRRPARIRGPLAPQSLKVR